MSAGGDIDRTIVQLAKRQYGLVTYQDLVKLGVSNSGITSRTRRHMLERLFRGVYRVLGMPDSWIQLVLGACLATGPGAAASHLCAARVWGLDVPSVEVVEVTVPRSRRAVRVDRSVVVHRRLLPPSQIGKRNGVPVTSVARTLLDVVDILERIDGVAATRVVDDAVLRGLTRPQELVRIAGRPADLRQPGGRVLRAALEPWLTGNAPESVPEATLARILRRAGIPAPVRQYKVFDHGAYVTRLDNAWPDKLVALEVDGFRYHASPSAQARDSEVTNHLAAIGWSVIRTTPRELAQPGDAYALDALRRRLGMASTRATFSPPRR